MRELSTVHYWWSAQGLLGACSAAEAVCDESFIFHLHITRPRPVFLPGYVVQRGRGVVAVLEVRKEGGGRGDTVSNQSKVTVIFFSVHRPGKLRWRIDQSRMYVLQCTALTYVWTIQPLLHRTNPTLCQRWRKNEIKMVFISSLFFFVSPTRIAPRAATALEIFPWPNRHSEATHPYTENALGIVGLLSSKRCVQKRCALECCPPLISPLPPWVIFMQKTVRSSGSSRSSTSSSSTKMVSASTYVRTYEHRYIVRTCVRPRRPDGRTDGRTVRRPAGRPASQQTHRPAGRPGRPAGPAGRTHILADSNGSVCPR